MTRAFAIKEIRRAAIREAIAGVVALGIIYGLYYIAMVAL